MKTKKILTPVLSLVLVFSLALPAFAIEYSVEGMEKLAGSSPSVRLVDYNLAALPTTHDLETQLTALGQSLNAIVTQKNSMNYILNPDLGDSDNPKPAPSTYDVQLASSVSNMLTYTETSLRGSIASVEAQITTIKTTKLTAQAAQAGVKETIAYSAEALLLTYYGLEDSEKEIQANIRKLTRKMAQLDKMYELGMVSKLDRERLESSLAEVENTLDVLSTTKTSIIGNINVLLGRDFSEENTVAALKPVTDDDLKSVKSYSTGLETAIKNNKKLGYLNEKVGELRRLNQNDVPVNYSEAAAETEALDYKHQAEAAFYSVYQDLLAKQKDRTIAQSAFDLAKSDLELAEKKFSLGMISSDAMEDAKDDYEIAKVKINAAELALKKAYRAYDYSLRGIVISSGQ